MEKQWVVWRSRQSHGTVVKPTVITPDVITAFQAHRLPTTILVVNLLLLSLLATMLVNAGRVADFLVDKHYFSI